MPLSPVQQRDHNINNPRGANKLQVIREETGDSHCWQSSHEPLYTEMPGIKKTIRVYVDKDVEFNLEICNDQLTCGWLLSEVTRKYNEELNRIKKEKEQAAQI